MKKNKIILSVCVLVASTTLIIGALKERATNLFRYAAGESAYERTHPKPRKKQ